MNKMRFLKTSIIFIFLLLFSGIGVQTAKAVDNNDVESLIAAEGSVAGYVATLMILREVLGLRVPSFWEMSALDNPYLAFVPDMKPPSYIAPNITMEYSDESDPVPEGPANTKPVEKPSKHLTPQEEEMRDAWKKAWEKTWGEPWPTRVDGSQQDTSGGDSTYKGDKNEWEGLDEEFPEGEYIPFKGEGENSDEDEERKPGGGVLGNIERLRQEMEKCKDDDCRNQFKEKIKKAMAEAAKALNEISRDDEEKQDGMEKENKNISPEGGEEEVKQSGGIIGAMRQVQKKVQESTNSTEANE